MTTVNDVLRVAVAEVGYTESPPNSNQNKYGQWYGMNHVPWCAIFVSYCFDRAGLTLPIRTAKGFAYCQDGVHWFQRQGRWFSQPQVGDVVFYCWRGDGISDHVGIVETIHSDGSVTSIEGNTAVGNESNGGAVMRRQRRPGVIMGYGRPAYKQQPTPASTTQNTTPTSPTPETRQQTPTETVPEYHRNLLDALTRRDSSS
ncbi:MULTISPECIES: CHAP domain-containing protein [Arthrospira]|jgi:hypothetical protein|uniref:Peptidase C51 domain-containing protein n=1 Tax=Limnospira platensis NIES-46 TaxID=1236695 RepID=A0A5M3T3M4_LIMPL|nr:CHAP domain-containing protein [Arthrospira platensis]AMW27000.1 hypothetical protein AP285_02345 [Arthrospira platensis YZ]KDR54667.1 hypothetical protein APPUASWS_027715 [Arthrospira platensis str. Paraca]MBD2670715.1 CHAP domain-containing protein [Arthrospira platensis FACHB-439]MBD2711502.1 CHAP domain-containing protein [Arthrospira platensis FACHB-835]MDF2211587.1 CHAP domain-containing protein [Arthrospira platensis NCB002]MDT9183764.1 CHAP domain-containing protein [Limnospira sp.